MNNQGTYCKAGFLHLTGEPCPHAAGVPGIPATSKRRPFPDDFYSPEKLAERKEQNRQRYQPGRTRRRRDIEPLVDLPYHVDEVGAKPYLLGDHF